MGVLLQDEKLADQLDWLQDKTAVGVLREAFLLELQCTAGTTRVWGIVERARGMLVGAVLARQTLSGIELEVLCASAFWQQGISDEVFDSASGWIADNMEMDLVVLQ